MNLSEHEILRLRTRLTSLVFEVLIQLVEWREMERLFVGRTHDLANIITHVIVKKLMSDIPRLRQFYQDGGHSSIKLESAVTNVVIIAIEENVAQGDYRGHRRIMAREFTSVVLYKLEHHPMIATVLGIQNPRKNSTIY